MTATDSARQSPSGEQLLEVRGAGWRDEVALEPCFAGSKASLPVGGVDGNLACRFTRAPLRGHVFAKTGTLGEERALSGYLDCVSGRTVIFSIMVDNHAPHSHADETAMDKIVAAIAATN